MTAPERMPAGKAFIYTELVNATIEPVGLQGDTDSLNLVLLPPSDMTRENLQTDVDELGATL